MFKVISPVDKQIIIERDYASSSKIKEVLEQGAKVKQGWSESTLLEREVICTRMLEILQSQHDELAYEVTMQMGMPITLAKHEITEFIQNSQFMISVAKEALQETETYFFGETTTFIKHEPRGLILIIGAWDHPYLALSGIIIPALMAGNVVLLNHDEQTALCAERLIEAGIDAGLPTHVLQYVHTSPEDKLTLVNHEQVNFVTFSGSVEWGSTIQHAASSRFIGTLMQLAGNDPAYVRADADIDHSARQLVRGTFLNSGQSRSNVKRLYIAEEILQDFLNAFRHYTYELILGDPRVTNTDIGPVLGENQIRTYERKTDDAIKMGAIPLIDSSYFPQSTLGAEYIIPQAFVTVDNTIRVMKNPSEAPIVGIMAVSDEETAIAYMNDSAYGISASIWTEDETAAIRIGAQIETGTFFMNACKIITPTLAWTGVKQSGIGFTLSRMGYQLFTRPKSFYLKP